MKTIIKKKIQKWLNLPIVSESAIQLSADRLIEFVEVYQNNKDGDFLKDPSVKRNFFESFIKTVIQNIKRDELI